MQQNGFLGIHQCLIERIACRKAPWQIGNDDTVGVSGIACFNGNRIPHDWPPLEVLLRSLEKLRDLRMAAERDDIPSRYRDIQSLQESLR